MEPENTSDGALATADDTTSTSEPTVSQPPVVAVVVTCNPGPWFEDTLAALRDQDYPNLAVLIIDAASAEDPLPRIASVLPGAYVRRLSKNPGYGAAANRALRIVQGAEFLVMCHDDIAPEPSAIRIMVEASNRGKAGVVTPKFVQWDDPSVLLGMGGTVDMTGVFVPEVDRLDLDQGQHDMGDETFVALGGCMLVRSELFATLGGFDAAMTLYGEDVDFSWRARIAGERIVTAPTAKVRHLEAVQTGMRSLGQTSQGDATQTDDVDVERPPVIFDEATLRRRHRLRTVLKVHRRLGLLLTLLQMLIVSIVDLLHAVAFGHRDKAGAVVAAWTWNLAHLRGLVKLRRYVFRVRKVPNRILRREYGSVRNRLAAGLRREWEHRRQLASFQHPRRELTRSLRRLPIIAWTAIVLVWLVGTRRVWDSGAADVGQMVPVTHGTWDSLRAYLGLLPGPTFGTDGLTSPAHALIGLASVLTLGSMNALETIALLAVIPIGVFGAMRLARPLKSSRSQLAVAFAYAVVPLPYDSFGLGRWDGLLAYAAAPWLMSFLMRLQGSAPYIARSGSLHVRLRRASDFDDDELEKLVMDRPTSERIDAAAAVLDRRKNQGDIAVSLPKTSPLVDRAWFLIARRAFPFALLLAGVGAFAPQFIVTAFVIAAALVLGALTTGQNKANAVRTLGVTFFAMAVALVLLLPALIGSSDGWRSLYSAAQSFHEPDGLGSMLRFTGGGFGASFLVYGLLIAGAIALLFGRAWRLALAIRLWFVTLALVVVAWLSARGWLGVISLDPHVLLGPAAVALALNIGLGVSVIEQESEAFGSVGSARIARLGRIEIGGVVPRAASIVAIACLVLAFLPLTVRAYNGAWGMPRTTTSTLLSWMPEQTDKGSFRVMWLGDYDAVPGKARRFSDDLYASIAVDGPMPSGLVAPEDSGGPSSKLAKAVATARAGNTVELGRLLAPYSIRYVVIPTKTGSVGGGGVVTPPPSDLAPTLANQLDLRSVESDPSVVVYENAKWIPMRSTLPPPALLSAHSPAQDALQSADVIGAQPVLPNRTGTATWQGPLGAGGVFISQAANSWELTVDGQTVERSEAFQWANDYAVETAGNAQLEYHSPIHTMALQLLNALAWLVVAGIAFRYRVRRGRYS